MSRTFSPNKYNVGDTVTAKSATSQKLVIRRYIDQVYYCQVKDDPEKKELVYYERELVEDMALIEKNKNSGQGEKE
ncbi:hypothetical protein [Ekhidna sp.]|uniref:hypothetical protein n=1 Tax=Ekhidna sp. TaxID=2608089 RepID=UPI003518C6D7